MNRTLHLPIDLELTDGVRLLASALADRRSEDPVALAMLSVVRLWVDWGRQRTAWRPLRLPGHEETGGPPPVVSLIEAACGWPGPPGALHAALLAAGVLVAEVRDGCPGLRCPAFEAENSHLLAGYQSHHQRAGHATARNRRLAQARDAGARTVDLAKAQGVLLLADPGISEEDRRAAIGLLAQLSTACNRPILRTADLRDRDALLQAALHRVRLHPAEEIAYVLHYLMGMVANPAVPKDPEAILQQWDHLLRLAKPAILL